MDQAAYLADKLWQKCGSMSAPVEPRDIASLLQIRGKGFKKPAAVLMAAWGEQAIDQLSPPAGAIQYLDNPHRIDCRYRVGVSSALTRYTEAYLLGCVLLHIAPERPKYSFDELPHEHDESRDIHRFARRLLMPQKELKHMMEIGLPGVSLSEYFDVPVWVAEKRVADLTLLERPMSSVLPQCDQVQTSRSNGLH